jgi:hypothetical protein
MANPMAMAMLTSRASRQPLFANSQRHRITQTMEIKIPPGASNEPETSPSARIDTRILVRRRSTGSATQVLA